MNCWQIMTAMNWKGRRDFWGISLISMIVSSFLLSIQIRSMPLRPECRTLSLKKDLIICSQSWTSEVLRRKGPLSLSMIRSLHKHLNIQAEILIQNNNIFSPAENAVIDSQKFPVSKKIQLSCVKGIKTGIKGHAGKAGSS